MDKPQPKSEIAIFYAMRGDICISASHDALEDIKEFGRLWKTPDSDLWHLSLDPRYDFDEVVAYIKNYG